MPPTIATPVARTPHSSASVPAEYLVAEYRSAIEATIRRTSARWRVSEHEFEDLSQHLWCLVLDRDARILRHFEGRSAVSSYLFPIMMMATRKWLERRSAERRHEVPVGDTYAVFASALAQPAGNASPTEAEQRRLDDAIATRGGSIG